MPTFSEKYHARKFSAYFQITPNTYFPADDFARTRNSLYRRCCGVYVPPADFLNNQYYEVMAEIVKGIRGLVVESACNRELSHAEG